MILSNRCNRWVAFLLLVAVVCGCDSQSREERKVTGQDSPQELVAKLKTALTKELKQDYVEVFCGSDPQGRELVELDFEKYLASKNLASALNATFGEGALSKFNDLDPSGFSLGISFYDLAGGPGAPLVVFTEVSEDRAVLTLPTTAGTEEKMNLRYQHDSGIWRIESYRSAKGYEQVGQSIDKINFLADTVRESGELTMPDIKEIYDEILIPREHWRNAEEMERVRAAREARQMFDERTQRSTEFNSGEE